MPAISIATTDSLLNNCLSQISAAANGRDARSGIVSAIDRCYSLAVIRAGSPKNGITRSVINVHLNRIRNAVFGEEVRDAIRTALRQCYSARGISVSSAANSAMNAMIEAQTGPDLKATILESIARCGQDVKS